MSKLKKFNKNSCFFDPITSTWHRIKRFEVTDGKFSLIESNECSPKDSDISNYILPGFLDAHSHILENPYQPDYNVENLNFVWQKLLLCAKRNLKDAYSSGITSIKDLGGREFLSIQLRNHINSLPIRFFTSGCYFTYPKGHCYDRGAIEIRDFDSFRQKIKYLKFSGIKFCKIINSDEGFNLKLLTLMINEAKDNGMLVSCHAYTEKAAYNSVLAGTDILEHAGDYSEKLLKEIKDKDIIIIPTYVAANDSTPENCDVLSDVNIEVINEWLKGENKVIPKLFNLKLKVGLGTDSGFPGTPCNSLIREIQLLHKKFDIPIKELMYSAFIITPKTVLMDDCLGQIKPGFYADFQCFSSNPLDNLSLLGNPSEVWVNGKKIDINKNELVNIRRLKEKDINGISYYLHHYYFDCGVLNDFWSDQEISEWINDKNDYCIGAFIDDILIGFCLTHYHKSANKVYLENIFILTEYRQKGIANNLTQNVINYYSSDCSKVRFVGFVDINNLHSIRLLEKNFFSKGHPMFWMQRNIIFHD